MYFAVWAPHAEAVSVVGDFSGWEIEANPMEREEPLGIYTCFIPGLEENTLYKYCIKTYTGEHIFKADPFANYAELRPGTASRVTDIEHLKWTDTQWMEKRKTWKHEQEPMSIYEAYRILEAPSRPGGRGLLFLPGVCEGDREIREGYGIYPY